MLPSINQTTEVELIIQARFTLHWNLLTNNSYVSSVSVYLSRGSRRLDKIPFRKQKVIALQDFLIH